MTTAIEGRETLSTPEVAKALGISVTRMKKLIVDGYVRVVPVPGARPLIPKSELRRLLAGAPMTTAG